MKATLHIGKDIDTGQWDLFVSQSPQGNIYHCHQYLTNLLPQWEAVVITEGAQIVAAMPYECHQKWGIRYARQPFFAQYLGILFCEKSDNTYKNLEFQKKAVQAIHETLPSNIKLLDFHFAPQFNYDLALLWLGWTQRMRFTYWVDISKGYEVFLQSSASHVRREIKKTDEAGIQIKVENSPEKVVGILKMAKPEAAKGVEAHYFQALINNSRHYFETQQSCCLIAYDVERPIAGIIYFFFKNKMIYYQGSTLPEYKNSGAMTKIIAESVRLYGARYQYLDFDGSMMEPIERFFRGFGAFPVRYSHFTLNRLPLLARWAFWWQERS